LKQNNLGMIPLIEQERCELLRSLNEAKGFNMDSSSARVTLLIASEFMEYYEAYRKDLNANLEEYLRITDGSCIPSEFKKHIKGSMQEELADVAIRIQDLLGYKDLPPNTLDQTNAVINAKQNDDLVPNGDDEDMDELVNYLVNLLTTPVESIPNKLAESWIAVYRLEPNLDTYIELKLEYNKTRDYLHGKKF